MRVKLAFLGIAMIGLLPSGLWAANKSFSFYCRTKVIRGNQVTYENRQHTYNFRIDVVSDHYGQKSENYYYRHPFIQVQPEERYAIVLHNPLPVRAAINLLIDGINSITGNPGSPSSGSKWLLEPRSRVTIRGWQVNDSELRRFYFTSKRDSYAAWRSHQLGQDLTLKCGMIAAAYFWNRRELENYFERNPIYEHHHIAKPGYPKLRSSQRPIDEEKREQAGTGMGERNQHPVYEVDFYYDIGMYNIRDMVAVYYDFSRPTIIPHHYRNYAPEKP